MNSLVEALKNSIGINISRFEDVFVHSCIQKRMKELGITTNDEYIQHIISHHSEQEAFSESLFVSFSEFFRQPLTFEVLEGIVVPHINRELASSGQKEIRFWSMACAGGEEPYSLAIALKECGYRLGEQIRFRIFATDYSENAINKAKKGYYKKSALKNVSLNRVENWFIKQGQTYEVHPDLKERIDFSVFDLLNNDCSCPEASIYGDFNIVVCSNVLFYYKPHYQKIIIEKACSCLRKDGFIISSKTERKIFLDNNFVEIVPNSAIFRQKPLD